MKYDRHVYIILRDGEIRGVISCAREARASLKELKENSMPKYDPAEPLEQYMRRSMEEDIKWRLETWPIVQTMRT